MLKTHKGGYLVKLVDNRCRPYLNDRIPYAQREPPPLFCKSYRRPLKGGLQSAHLPFQLSVHLRVLGHCRHCWQSD
jgi:hypothetical protein